jgi:hypothetical protein
VGLGFVHDARTMRLPSADVPIHQFRRLEGALTYGIVCAHSRDIEGMDRTRQLDLMRDSILQSNDAVILAERPITVGGHPGRGNHRPSGSRVMTRSAASITLPRLYSIGT